MKIGEFYKVFINQGFSFSTDSRNIRNGDIFFALKGDNFNGNTFASKALAQGASYVVIDEGEVHDERFIKVDDVLRYFQDLATYHRNCFDIPVIGIAGSNGKTTTKNLIRSVLERQFKTHCTAGNFNNHIGVPITILQMPIDTEMAIIELGTNNPGEITFLCDIANPNYGLITNIGKEHLEGFGTLEAVAKEESAMYLHLLKNNSVVFVNEDDEWLMRMSRSIEKRVNYGRNNLDRVDLIPTIQFEYKQNAFKAVLMGAYNLENILAALSIGEFFGMELETVAEGIAAYRPENNRSQIIEHGTNLIWLDAYNANPSSMEKAIESFHKLPHTRKVLILGDMFEMGSQAFKEHKELLRFAISLGFKDILLLGSEFKKASEDLDLEVFEHMIDLQEHLKRADYENSAFLVKGSRGMRMEDALKGLAN